MKIIRKYSHFYGEEYLLVHQKELYKEITDIIEEITPEKMMLKSLRELFHERGLWTKRSEFFIKNKIAVGVQLNKSLNAIYNTFVKHLLFYSNGFINVGVEILPIKKMQLNMSSGAAYYEGAVYNILRHGRSDPPIPLLIIGIES